MAIEAPISKFKRNGLIIWMVACIVVGAYCAYDGYFNEKFKEKHTNEDGTPDSTLVFNRKSPPFFFGAGVLLGAYWSPASEILTASTKPKHTTLKNPNASDQPPLRAGSTGST